jgi:phospholipase/lecithinase/hemolysin
MTFSRTTTPRWLATAASRVVTLVAGLTLGLLASCGGGTTQYDRFVPGRILAFGDDSSSFTPTGRTYSVNGLNANNEVDCTVSPIWVQSLANNYGFVFAECNPTFETPKARTLAFPGAKVDDVTAQVEAQVASGGFRDKDLATVFVGVNDILELYAQYPSLSEDVLLAQARDRGQRLARAVNRLVDLGAKVIVSDLPDVGLTPYARQQDALNAGRAALMTRLTSAFNEQLGTHVLLDGRYVGLVQAQLRFTAASLSPASFGLTNVTDAVCTAPVPDCTTATVLDGADPNGYMWSDDTHLGRGAHAQLASLAVDRAARNPF